MIRLAEAPALQPGADGEHTEVGGLAAVFELAAGDQLTVALHDEQGAAGGGDDLKDAFRVGAAKPSSMSASVVQPVRLASPRYADSISRTSSRHIGLDRVTVGELAGVPEWCGVHEVGSPLDCLQVSRD